MIDIGWLMGDTAIDPTMRSRGRLPGSDPDAPTRTCLACGWDLELAYFNYSAKTGKYSPECFVCRDDARAQRPWTEAEYEAVRQAARRALDLWPRYADRWEERDLVIWRDLLSALDRDIASSGESG